MCNHSSYKVLTRPFHITWNVDIWFLPRNHSFSLWKIFPLNKLNLVISKDISKHFQTPLPKHFEIMTRNPFKLWMRPLRIEKCSWCLLAVEFVNIVLPQRSTAVTCWKSKEKPDVNQRAWPNPVQILTKLKKYLSAICFSFKALFNVVDYDLRIMTGVI